MLGRVAGRVQHLGGHVSERQHVAVAHAMKLGRGLGAGKEDIFRAGGVGQAPSRRDVVRVNMRVDDVEDAHPRVFGGLKIGRDIADRVDDRRRRPCRRSRKGRKCLRDWRAGTA